MAQPRIMLLGPPGAGKGTQSAKLADYFDIDHITTGDALRANKDMETEYGTPREYMDAGELVPDPVVNEIVEAALTDADGFVLDGYPRNKAQAEYLDSITDLDVIVHLKVSKDELLVRLTGRRICEECGTNYHTKYNPPETPGECDECGGALIQRDDDSEETARERIRVFEENTLAVVEHYDTAGQLRRIDGERPPEAVWEQLKSTVETAIEE